MSKTLTAIITLAFVFAFTAAADAQALWRQDDPSQGTIYTYEKDKPKEWKKHDLILVRINEVATSRRQDELETNREFTTAVDVPTLPFRNDGENTERLFATDVSAEVANANDAERLRRSQFSDVIMAEIVEIMPGYDPETGEGQAKIRAYKYRRLMEDVEKVSITGRISLKHIDATDDSISADRVFGADIEYDGTGDISDNAKEGWLASVLKYVWPF